MENQQGPHHPFANRTYRLLSGAFGVFLIGVGGYALAFGVPPLNALRVIVGSALVLAGGNLVVSAYTAKESWLSRLGPLP